MPLNANLARVGINGAVYVGPLNTAPPTDVATAWVSAMQNVGFISDDGLQENRDDSRTSFTPWQARNPIRTVITASTKTFQFTMWETNFNSISLYHGISAADMHTSGTGESEVVSFAEPDIPTRDLRVFGFDVVDGAYARRIFLPNAEVTDRGNIVYKADSLIAYQVTVTAYPATVSFNSTPTTASILRFSEEGWAPPASS